MDNYRSVRFSSSRDQTVARGQQDLLTAMRRNCRFDERLPDCVAKERNSIAILQLSSQRKEFPEPLGTIHIVLT